MSVNLGNAYGAIRIDGSGAMGTINQVSRGLLGMSGPFGKASIAAAGLGVAMLPLAGAGAAISGAIISSTKTAEVFEQAMSRVGALTYKAGESAEETAARMEAMTSVAEELGATTAFTATQAAEGMQFLAMAGYETNDIIAAMPGLLSAAAAGQLDLATTSDIVSNVLSGFGMEAEQTGELADILTKTFTSANVDMRMLGESMKYVAPVAASLGIGIEETAAAVGLLGNAGIQGTMAGTALRTSLTQLAAPTGKAKTLIKQLGIVTQDSEGNMLPLNDLLGNINQAMDGMTAAQQAATVKTLVGTEAMSAFMVLLENSANGALPDFTRELEQAGGTAETVASKQLDNLAGAKTLLASAIDGIKTSIGNEFLPQMTAGTRRLTDFLTANREPIINFFGGIASWMSYLGDQAGPVITGIISRVSGLVQAFQAGGLFGKRYGSFGSAGLLTALGIPPEIQGTLQGIITDVTDFTGQVSGLVQAFQAGGLFGSRSGSFGSTGLLTALGVPPEIQDILQGIITDVTDFTGQVSGLVQAFQTGGLTGEGGVLDALGVSADMQSRIQAVIDGITNLGTEITNFANGALTAYSEGGLAGLISFITTEIDNAGPTIASHFSAWSELVWGWVQTAADAAAVKLNEWTAALVAWVNNPESQTSMLAMGQTIANVILGAFGLGLSNQENAGNALSNFVGALITSIPQIMVSLMAAGVQIAAGIFQGLWNGLTGDDLKAMTMAEFESMTNWMIDTISGMPWADIGTNIVDGIITGISDKATALMDTAKQTVMDAYDAVVVALQMRSPSKLFAGVGENIPLGMAQGISNTATAPADEIVAVAGSLPEYATAAAPQSVDNSRSTVNNFAMNIDKVVGDAGGVEQSFFTLRALAM